MEHRFLRRAFEWVGQDTGEGFLEEQEYCPTRDVFQARLESLRARLERSGFEQHSLFVASIGEIGNNAFDHNLGSWRDVPGIYFDSDETTVIVADRGKGVRATLSRIEPGLQSDAEALEIAFTRKISGRSPEYRGNGLKFVKSVIEKQKWSLKFFSGIGKARIDRGNPLEFEQNMEDIKGTVALVYI